MNVLIPQEINKKKDSQGLKKVILIDENSFKKFKSIINYDLINKYLNSNEEEKNKLLEQKKEIFSGLCDQIIENPDYDISKEFSIIKNYKECEKKILNQKKIFIIYKEKFQYIYQQSKEISIYYFINNNNQYMDNIHTNTNNNILNKLNSNNNSNFNTNESNNNIHENKTTEEEVINQNHVNKSSPIPSKGPKTLIINNNNKLPPEYSDIKNILQHNRFRPLNNNPFNKSNFATFKTRIYRRRPHKFKFKYYKCYKNNNKNYKNTVHTYCKVRAEFKKFNRKYVANIITDITFTYYDAINSKEHLEWEQAIADVTAAAVDIENKHLEK